MKKIIGVAVAGVFVTGVVVGGFLASMLLNEYDEEKKPIFDIKEGDLVQWQSQGVLQFPQPRKVENLQTTYIGGKEARYVFVEGTTTGIPIEQVILMKRDV